MRHTFSITKVDLNEGIAEANKREQTKQDHFHICVKPLAIDMLLSKGYGYKKGTNRIDCSTEVWSQAIREAKKQLRNERVEKSIAREFKNLKA